MGCSCGIKHNEKLNIDPTQTKILRDKYSTDSYKRFRNLKGLVRKTLIDNNALNLINRKLSLNAPDDPQPKNDFEFEQDYDKVDAFMDWLQEAEDKGILEVIKKDGGKVAARNEWQNKYVKAAYKKGFKDATTRLAKTGIKVAEYSSVETAFFQSIHSNTLGMLYTRNFRELKGITNAMDQQISRELTRGISKGDSAYTIAKAINDRIDKIGITRARVLARTEIVRAYNESALNRYEEAGVEGVDVKAEHSTAGDKRVCATCKALESKTYTIEEARDKIPVHPRCRCTWLPKRK